MSVDDTPIDSGVSGVEGYRRSTMTEWILARWRRRAREIWREMCKRKIENGKYRERQIGEVNMGR